MEQVTQHLEEADLMPEFQSAYRKHHCTVSALMKVLSDSLDAADCRQVTLLGLLDLSAAFDTVDHDIPLVRLETLFGIGGSVLAWLKSFLSDKQQAVSLNGVTSAFDSLSVRRTTQRQSAVCRCLLATPLCFQMTLYGT